MEHQVTTHYLAVSLALLSLACSLNLALLLHSSRGRIWPESSEDEPHPRACVEPLLYAIIALTVIEFFWTELGTYFAVKDFNRCFDQEHERTVIVGQFLQPSTLYLG